MAATAALAGEPGATKETSGPSFDVEIAAGVDYDSNISVNQLDTNTGQDDFAAALEADFDLTVPLGPNTEFQLGYGFSQSLHFDFTDFDLQSHLATADISHDFGIAEIGAAYRFANSRLGGDPFLTMHQVNPYISKFIGKTLYVRAGYTWSDKDFEEPTAISPPPTRDARNSSFGGDVYIFLDGVKTYIVGGYEREMEKAVSDEFDFHGDNFRVRFAQRFRFGASDAELSLGYRLEDRNYDNVTPSILTERDDKRQRFQADLELSITDNAFVRLEYEYGDYRSNLPSADFKQNLAGVRLGLKF
jgi:opacity protein-like surface antigen